MATLDHKEPISRQGYDLRVVARLLGYLRPYKAQVAVSICLAIISAPLTLAAVPLTKALVDLYLAPNAANTSTGFTALIRQTAHIAGLDHNAFQGIVLIALLFLIANVASALVTYAQAVILQRLGQSIMFDVRRQIFGHLHKLPIQFFNRNPVGGLMSRLTTDVDALNDLFTSALLLVLGDIAVAVYIVTYMLKINWQLALVSFAILPLLLVLTAWFRRGTRAAFRRIRVRIGRINAFLQEHITGMAEVQLFNREARELRGFAQINEEHRQANVSALFYYALFFPAVALIEALGIALVIWFGGGEVIAGIATLGTLIAFVQLAGAFYDPISDISEKYNIVQLALVSAERVFDLLDEPVAVQQADTVVDLDLPSGRIEFRNVWFAYSDEDWILKDISFIVELGERVALVGYTGAGKSTIINLLLRFYEIQRGEILLDGVDIRRLDPTALRRHFNVVPQDVFLFSGDIRSNIKLSDDGLTDEQVFAAAREVRADDFIRRLPDGYATKIGERGTGLSFGQKQLISFARALARDQRILILDEATSAVDPETQYLISEALKRLQKGRTCLVIAHRLSTIQNADKVIVLHKGEIRETGTHDDLLRRRDLYWELYQLDSYQHSTPTEVVQTATAN